MNDAPKSAAPSPPDPAVIQSMLHQAVALRRQNDIAGAERVLRATLAIDLRNYDAMHLLGVLALDSGNGAQAVDMIAAAIRLDSSKAAAHYNLGNALRLLKRHPAAITCYDRALALDPDYARAHNNRANSLFDLKRHGEAVDSYSRAVAIEPGFADAWHNRGHALNELQRYDEAIESYRRALAAGGDKARLDYELAALGAGSTPNIAPEKYVTQLFDRYAEQFDRHLVENLDYRIPVAAVDAVKPLFPSRELDILDLGCGTGLCGPLLQPFARSLTGVDLSEKMLDKARDRGVYARLVCGDIAKYLQTNSGAFDLIIATDVFVYIGELSAVFAGAKRALKSCGLFTFSAERGEGGDYTLQISKRYAHTEAYLRRLAVEHGFSLQSLARHVIRKDGDADIDGWVAVLRLDN